MDRIDALEQELHTLKQASAVDAVSEQEAQALAAHSCCRIQDRSIEEFLEGSDVESEVDSFSGL
jgi:hypothetical protein